jgi:hypothetical protein
MLDLPTADIFSCENLGQSTGIQELKKSTSFQHFMTFVQFLIFELMWKTFFKLLKIIKKG